MKLSAALALLALAGCNAPESTPPTETPPFVGHWNLEGSQTGEHLWIEVDGTFTEAGGPALASTTLSALLSSGTWTLAPPKVTFDDARTGVHAFDYSIQADGTLFLQQDLSHSYRLARDTADAGP